MTSLIIAVDASTLASSLTPALDNTGVKRHRLKTMTKTAKAHL
jgi:hypothetical protein